MKRFYTSLFLFLIGPLFLSIGAITFAAKTPNPPGGTPPSGGPPVIFNNIGDVIAKICVIFYWLFTAAIIISIIMLIWGAINYMIGGAEPEKIKTATSMFKYSITGIVIAILAKAVPSIVASFLGSTLPPAC